MVLLYIFLRVPLFLEGITAGDKKQNGIVPSASCSSGVPILLSQKHIVWIL